MAGAQHSTALKRVNKKINGRPAARTARDTKRQRAACKKVTTKRVPPMMPLSTADIRARHMSEAYGTAVIATPNGKVYSGEFRANELARAEALRGQRSF